MNGVDWDQPCCLQGKESPEEPQGTHVEVECVPGVAAQTAVMPEDPRSQMPRP